MTKKRIETTDIIFAAVLRVNSYKLHEIIKDDKRGTFVFLEVEEEIINKYNLGQTLVEPNEFNSAIKFLTMAVKRV